MKTFSKIKDKIKRYQDEVRLLNLNIASETDVLKKELGNYLRESKFLSVKLNNGKDYYYLSSFDLLDSDKFYGIRINSNGKLDIGKMSMDSMLNATEYETINAERFFGKMISLGIKLDKIDDPIAKECNYFKPVIVHYYGDRKNAVAYCRLSQNTGCKNKFDRQISLIKNFVEKSGEYNLSEIFTETITGVSTASQRTVFSDMIEYCTINDIHTVVISELNRLGRKKDTILSLVTHLSKHNINEIIVLKENMLINEEFLTNNYRKLNALAKSCEDEYENIKYRMQEGYKAYVEKREEAIKNGDTNIPVLGRVNYIKSEESYRKQYEKEIDLLSKPKMSLRQVRAITGTSIGTLQKLKGMFFNVKISDENQTLEPICN